MNRLPFVLLCLLGIPSFLFSQNEINPLEKALSSVVTVAIYELNEQDQPFGFGEGESIAEKAYQKALDLSGSATSGSGFVIQHNGQLYIVTNAHVIDGAENKSGAIRAFSIGGNYYPVKVIGGDSFYDIAVLAFEEPPGAELQAITFASAEARLTERVFAIGNPLGKYPYSITDGIVSGKNRLYQNPTTGKFGYLQHTATVSWGNSGGPLVNEKGEVVGVNSWIGTSVRNNQSYVFSQLNFAIEGNLTQRLVREIIENEGRVRRNYLGIEFATRVDMYGVESQPFIKAVFEQSATSNLLKDKKGYYIKSINDEPVRTLQDVLRIMEQTAVAESVFLSIQKEAPNSQSKINFLKADKIEIPGGHLTTERLEQIANYFFKNYSDYQLNNTDRKATISSKSTKPKPRLERMQIDESKTVFSMSAGNTSYEIIASGVLDKWGRGTLYRVQSAKDLGTIIRMSSLEGHLSAGVLSENAEMENVRFFLQDEDFNELRVLYY